ncbi:HTH_Tnp_Tc3_2 domain-containing protein [Trichonephila clavipes]|nr:HTH_Tnp_Tc3_2 domain-containing protein [Trichonephila clavipes]
MREGCLRPVSSGNRRVHLKWFRDPREWNMYQWVSVLCTDESRFSLTSDSRRTFIWREPSTHNALQCQRIRPLPQLNLDGLSRHHVEWLNTPLCL